MTDKLTRRNFAKTTGVGAAALAAASIAASNQVTAQDREFFDAGAEAKKKVNKRYDKYGDKERAASEGGKLKLVSDRI